MSKKNQKAASLKTPDYHTSQKIRNHLCDNLSGTSLIMHLWYFVLQKDIFFGNKKVKISVFKERLIILKNLINR